MSELPTITPLPIWRLRHPVRSARSLLPRLVPLAMRRRVFARRPAQSWGNPAAWKAALLLHRPLAPPRGVLPRASVCIIAYRNIHLTRLCVESVFRLTAYPDYEVIVVDNGSDDGTSEWIGEEHRIRAIRMSANAGFAAACNAAIAASDAPFIAILNNDVVVTEGWLGALIAPLLARPDIGMTGPVTNSCGNEARIRARYESFEAMQAFARRRTQQHGGHAFEIASLNFFCAVMRRSTWNDAGPLDERFGPGLFEDDDYCRRLRERGLRLVCREDTFVHHWGGAALRTLGEDEDALYVRNERLFRQKWRGR